MIKNIIFLALILGGLMIALSFTDPDPQPVDKAALIESKIDSIVAKMTLREKIGQTAQRGTSSRVKELPADLIAAVKNGDVGSFLNVTDKSVVHELQRIAVEESKHGIPLIFARDVIHGYKTIFPIPLGQAASFNPGLVQKGARIAAIEAATNGIKWTFAPMIDVSRDPRWGRIAESAGEDPHLNSVMAQAYVKGFQGDDLSDPSSIAACAKHFACYGAAEGGRDYNTVDISDYTLHNTYLKPFKAAVDAGAATFMSGFNEVNGVPASGNPFLTIEMLRETWGFDGFVVSDWESVTEMIAHGYAKDPKAAALKSASAMVDMEMTSTSYEDHLEALIGEGQFSEAELDVIVKNILRVKFRLGLFDSPYFDPDDSILYAPEHLEAAKQSAIESTVLLKNENKVLPISAGKKIAIIGPLADAPHEQLGTWTFDGDKTRTVTPVDAFAEDKNISSNFVAGLTYSRDKSEAQFDAAIAAAKAADVVVFFGGEEAILSGEAHSRAKINLPGAQEALITKLAETGTPVVLVIMAGRPITMEAVLDKVDAVVMAWHPGTMGGEALKDILTGAVSPSGRLPVTWPIEVGQIPLHYNHKMTGRPVIPEKFVQMDDIPIGVWQSSLGNTSHYLDAGYLPLYPFGYGLTYGNFSYDKVSVSKNTVKLGESITVSVTVTNKGASEAQETVQLYFRDLVGSLTRPVKELLQFEKVTLAAGASETVTFTFSTDDFAFYGPDKEWVTEPGDFKLWVGQHALDIAHEIDLTVE